MTDYPKRLVTRYSAPSEEPISLSEAKLFLKIDDDADDTLVTDMIVAVRIAAENYLRRSLVTQSWKLAFNDWVPDETDLPYGNAIAITSVTVINRDASQEVISDEAYHLDASNQVLVFDSYISGDRVEIIYSAGYGAASAVPKAIKQGMLMHIAELYDHRSSNAGLPSAARAMYDPFRMVSL